MNEPRVDQARSAHLALMGVQVCFGLFPLFGKWALDAFSPTAIASWRIAFGAALLAALALWRHGRAALPSLADLCRMQVLALLGVAGNQLLYLEGLRRSTAVNAGLMMLLIPMFTFLIAVLVRQERFTRSRAAGIAIALLGTLPLLLRREPDLSRPHLVGNLLMAGNTLLYSVYLVACKPMMRRYPAIVVIAWMYVLCLWTVPLVSDGGWIPPAAGTSAWLSLLAILLFPTVLAYLLNTYALGRVPASTTAVYIFVQPWIAGAAGAVLLGEELTWATGVGAAGMFAGLWLVLR